MLNSIASVQVSDTRDDDSSNDACYIIVQSLAKETSLNFLVARCIATIEQ
jgi:hypothetical protein